MSTSVILAALAFATSFVSARPGATVEKNTKCPLVYDGRVPLAATDATFDEGKLPYNPKYDLGANLTWADVLRFPETPKSLFDTCDTKAVEVTINDKAIFTPSPTDAQTGFRRNELLPTPADVNGSVTGIKTLHWSLMDDCSRPLNYSHEYMLVWLENEDYSADQFTLGTGTIYGDTGVTEEEARMLFIRGIDTASPQQEFLKTPFTSEVWHNFGLVLNFHENTLEVLYSTGNEPLVSKTKHVSNTLSGLGEYHFGILKKPTGPAADITVDGYQEEGINEGITYGGIFEEDSSRGCVSTMPTKS